MIIFFVYKVMQTSCFYEQSSRRVSSAVGAYWNPCLPFHLSSPVSLGSCVFQGIYLVALSVTNRPVACNCIFSFFIYRDASWEKGDAFADLLFQYSRCDAEKCICPHGREHEQRSGYR